MSPGSMWVRVRRNTAKECGISRGDIKNCRLHTEQNTTFPVQKPRFHEDIVRSVIMPYLILKTNLLRKIYIGNNKRVNQLDLRWASFPGSLKWPQKLPTHISDIAHTIKKNGYFDQTPLSRKYHNHCHLYCPTTVFCPSWLQSRCKSMTNFSLLASITSVFPINLYVKGQHAVVNCISHIWKMCHVDTCNVCTV